MSVWCLGWPAEQVEIIDKRAWNWDWAHSTHPLASSRLNFSLLFLRCLDGTTLWEEKTKPVLYPFTPLRYATIFYNFLKCFFFWEKELFSKIFFSLYQHRDTQETLAVLDRLDLDTEKPSEEELAKKFGYEEDFFKGLFTLSSIIYIRA